MRRSQGEKFAF